MYPKGKKLINSTRSAVNNMKTKKDNCRNINKYMQQRSLIQINLKFKKCIIVKSSVLSKPTNKISTDVMKNRNVITESLKFLNLSTGNQST